MGTLTNGESGLSIRNKINAQIGPYESIPPEIVSAYISGTTMVGKVLTVNKFYRDIDGTAEGVTTFQWVRADDSSGTNKANIAAATSSTYTLAVADVGKYIACEITPVNTDSETGDMYRTVYVGSVDALFYPLDNFSNVACAFAMKKLAAAYGGNCLQTQASNGGPTVNVGFDANGDIDWSLIPFDTTLKIFYDQSGNGNNMTFTTFADQPTINATDRRIEWGSGNDAIVTHAASLNIGTGEYTFFLDGNSLQGGDSVFTFFEKKTSFSANNLQLYNNGAQQIVYSGNASTNTLTVEYTTPDKRNLMCGYRSATTKYFRTDDTITSAAEVATDLTSTANMRFNTGDGGDGNWHFWAFILIKQNYGSDYSKVKKFLL